MKNICQTKLALPLLFGITISTPVCAESSSTTYVYGAGATACSEYLKYSNGSDFTDIVVSETFTEWAEGYATASGFSKNKNYITASTSDKFMEPVKQECTNNPNINFYQAVQKVLDRTH